MLTRALILIFALLNILVLVGVAIDGAIYFIKSPFPLDKTYSLAFFLIAVIFSIIVIQETRRILLTNISKWLSHWLKENRITIYASVAIIAILYVQRSEFGSILLYGGHSLGSFVLNLARNGYEVLFNIDIYNYGAQNLAWVAQFYYVWMIVGVIGGLIKRFTKK